jgi:predicted nuclease of restriction endonuclease-like RecB superfamily
MRDGRCTLIGMAAFSFGRPRLGKYNASKIKTHDGRSFASKGEAGLYDQLKHLEKIELIKLVKCQPRVKLEPFDIVMIPDFLIEDLLLKQLVYVEYKGFETSEYILKKKIWEVVGPARLRVYKGYGTALKITAEIIPTGKL